jgi:hypothetical protein
MEFVPQQICKSVNNFDEQISFRSQTKKCAHCGLMCMVTRRWINWDFIRALPILSVA